MGERHHYTWMGPISRFVLVLLVATGCTRAAVRAGRVVFVEPWLDASGLLLGGPGIAPGQRYLVFVGTRHTVARVTSEAVDVSHFDYPVYRAIAKEDLAIRAPHVTTSALAFGPVAKDRSVSAQVARMEKWSTAATPIVIASIDFGNDGVVDLEQVMYCRESVFVDCAHQIKQCTTSCTATRTAGRRSLRGELCRSNIPDIEDCEP